MNVVSLDGVPSIETDPTEEPDLYVYLGRVGGHLHLLLPGEAEGVTSTSKQRQEEFASGRRLAHFALENAGSNERAVLRLDRRPIWPENFLGSISHSDHLAACALAETSNYQGVGVDLAKVSAVSEYVANRVLSEKERLWIRNAGSNEWRTALFSAKEAIYKSINPITNEYLGFRDVEIEVASDALTFCATTLEEKDSTPILTEGRGYFHRVSGHWMTTFVVERS